MGENISVTKIKHLEKFMQNIPLNIFSRILSANIYMPVKYARI